MPIVSDMYGHPFNPDNNVQEMSAAGAAVDYAKTTPGFGGFVSAFNRSENPVASVLLPLAEQSEFRPRSFMRDYINGQMVISGGDPEQDTIKYKPSPVLSTEDANKRYPNPEPEGKPLFTEPTEEKLAETIAKQKNEQFQAKTDVARFQQNHGFVVNTAADIAATFTDPLNIATGFIPGVGEEALVARLGLGLGARIATRAVIGAELGATQQGINSALKYTYADDLRTDFSIRDGLRDTLYGAIGGAALNVGLRGLGDVAVKGVNAARARLQSEGPGIATADAATHQAAADSAISQLVTGRPVDVADFFAKAESLVDHPYFNRVDPAELGLNRQEIARSIDPKAVSEFEALQKTKADLDAQIQKAPTAELAELQKKLTDVEARMEPAVNAAMKQADETIGRATTAETGKRLDDLITQVKQAAPRDFTGLIEREKAWRDTGITSGITHDDLVRALHEVEIAARNKPAPVEITPPKEWAKAPETKAPETKAPETGSPGKEFGAVTENPGGGYDVETPNGIFYTKDQTSANALAAKHYVEDYLAGRGRDSPAHQQYAANNGPAIEAEFQRRAMSAGQSATETLDGAALKTRYPDPTKAADDTAKKARQALAEGGFVTVHDNGKQIPITRINDKGQMLDPKGRVLDVNRIVQKDQNRIEITTPPKDDPFPGINVEKLLPEEREKLINAHAELEKAQRYKAIYEEAALCLKGG